MRRIRNIFLKGLLTIVPLAVSVYLLFWLGQGLESTLGTGLRYVLPTDWYLPGLGVAVGLVVVFLIGLLLQALVVRKVWRWTEGALVKVPAIGELYRSLREVAGYLSGDEKPQTDQVIMLTIGDSAMRLMGLVTRDDFSDAPRGMGDQETVAVFLPWSYQLGGFTVYVPRSAIEPIDLSPQEAMRWALTGGVTTQKRDFSQTGKSSIGLERDDNHCNQASLARENGSLA